MYLWILCPAGLQQLQILRSGFYAAWDDQGPEVLLLHVLLELYDVISPEHYKQVLDAVAWDVLQQEEVIVLVNWCLQLPPDHPFTHGLQAKVLGRVAQQINGGYVSIDFPAAAVAVAGVAVYSSSTVSQCQVQLPALLVSPEHGYHLLLTLAATTAVMAAENTGRVLSNTMSSSDQLLAFSLLRILSLEKFLACCCLLLAV